MDDLTRVREMAAGVPPLTDEARGAARVRLRRAVTEETRRAAPAALSRRLVFRAVAAAGAVGVAGTAYAATRPGGVQSRGRDGERGTLAPGMVNLSAAQVLYKAAGRSRSDGAAVPVPRNDQYIYSKTYITRTYLEGGRKKTWTDESWLSVDGSRPSRRQEHGTVHNDPPLGRRQRQSFPMAYAQLEKIPKDPDALLKLFRSSGSSSERDLAAFSDICMLMMGPQVMPPGLEAAAFEALARVPGIRIDHDQVDALGRHGIGVSHPKASFTFVFDRRTYDYLGLRTKGSTPKLVHGKWRASDWYFEMRSLEQLGVVDEIGRRPAAR